MVLFGSDVIGAKIAFQNRHKSLILGPEIYSLSDRMLLKQGHNICLKIRVSVVRIRPWEPLFSAVHARILI